MNIVMITNTFTPHVSGVARSVEAFTAEYRGRGHRVLVIAPEFEGAPADEHDVVRVPAIQNFNGSDFSVRIPVPGFLSSVLDEFRPDIMHSHHPFLLGATALRLAASYNVPLVFTHHTMYERYTHYVPGDSRTLRQFVVELATGYANLCDHVFAPSESVKAVFRSRGVTSLMEVVPTGVDTVRFGHGDRTRFREEMRIPQDSFVVGHVGRLAEEKNLSFLAEAVARFLKNSNGSHFVVAGSGPSQQEIHDVFSQNGLSTRLHLAGVLDGRKLVDAYKAMDLFAFASQSETQGMVLTEAMAAGVSVVALDAPGVREVVGDKQNGRLLPGQDIASFVSALRWVRERTAQERQALQQAALKTADSFSMPRCAKRALSVYDGLIHDVAKPKDADTSLWEVARRGWEAEWEIWANRAHAAGAALAETIRPSNSGC
jgi:glycosyltransferase involved in cell wall biosynthesis